MTLDRRCPKASAEAAETFAPSGSGYRVPSARCLVTRGVMIDQTLDGGTHYSYPAGWDDRPVLDALPAYWTAPPARREARLDEFMNQPFWSRLLIRASE
jgi:hypothetical protein